MARKLTNGRHAAGISTSRATRDSWAILDALPPVVRRALHAAPVSINPASAHALIHYYDYGPNAAAAALLEAAATEIQAFAAEHQVQHGYPLPHVAAGATVQPY